jgi:serine/threonine protein kinase
MLRCRGLFQGANALLFDESPTFSAPAAFGTFRVLHQAGSGVLGPVFRTSHPRRPDLVAIKAFKLDLLPEEVVRLADALRRLAADPPAHPALAAIVDAGLEGTTPFLATEFLIGDTLDVVLRRRAPLGVPEALRLLTPVGEALDAAWAAGAGHGALHPRDVFVGSEAHAVKVTGVGIVPALEAAGLSAPARRPYAAPERTSGAWDRRADVYSLAVVAHELLTGRRPAGANEQDGVFASDVTPEQRVAIRRVLSRGLAERPDDRYPTATAFLEAVAAAGAGAAVPARPAPAAEPIQPDLLRLATSDETHGPPDQLPPAEVPPVRHDLPLAAMSEFAPESDSGPTMLDLDEPALVESVRSPMAAAAPSFRDRIEPLEELSYRPAAGQHEPGDPVLTARTPVWQPSAPPRSSHASRWVAIVLVGLVAGAAAGYFAGAYDPFAEATLEDQPVADVATAVEPGTGSPTPPPEPPIQPSTGTDADTVAALAPPATDPAPDPPATPRVRDVAPPERPAAPPLGAALAIRSQPSGAMVTIDGRLMGETPIVLRDLAAGPYLLQVARPGYAPHQERVTLPAGGGERTLSVALEAGVTAPGPAQRSPAPGPGRGAIEVDSSPRGARVVVDGRFVGLTPLRLPEVASGSHAVTVELAGHSSVTRRALVESGQTAKVSVALR